MFQKSQKTYRKSVEEDSRVGLNFEFLFSACTLRLIVSLTAATNLTRVALSELVRFF